MDLARITSKGQITIPSEIRKKLNLKEGDKVIFIEDGDKIIFANSSMVALKKFQNEMKGKAQEAGLTNENDVENLIKQVRKEILEEQKWE